MATAEQKSVGTILRLRSELSKNINVVLEDVILKNSNVQTFIKIHEICGIKKT
jgi:hypothetical protein